MVVARVEVLEMTLGIVGRIWVGRSMGVGEGTVEGLCPMPGAVRNNSFVT